MRKLVFWIGLFLGNFAFGQDAHKLLISLRHSCSYVEAPNSDNLYAFKTSEEALEIINKICKVDGIDPNFEVHSANIPNAKAVLDNNVRIILYSESFIQKINLISNTNWAGVSILAHEIGHHLNGHTLDENSSRPELELKADQFSGFILRKLGASLDDAQIAVNTLCPNDGTAMYPPKSARLEAIAVGWQSGEDVSSKDFSKFLNTVPRNLKSKSFYDATYHISFNGTGSISLQFQNNKLKVSGQLDYKALYDRNGHEYFADGSFSGTYFINMATLKRKFPYTILIDADGKLKYGFIDNRYGITRSCDFEKITLVIKDENEIECSVNLLNGINLLPVDNIIFR